MTMTLFELVQNSISLGELSVVYIDDENMITFGFSINLDLDLIRTESVDRLNRPD